MPTTIYRQQWLTTFARPDFFQQWEPAGGGYNPLGPGYPYPNGIADGESIKVVTSGTMEVDDSAGGDAGVAGVKFYGIGEGDPERYQVTDDSTYAWDQRAVIIEVTNTFVPLPYTSQYRILTIAKGLFESAAPFEFVIDTDANDFTVSYRTGSVGATSAQFDNWVNPGTYSVDNTPHRWKFLIQPGTITGDPLSGSFSVAADGYWKICLDDVLIRQVTGIALTFGYNSADVYTRSPVHVRSGWVGSSGLLGPNTDFWLYRLTTGDTGDPIDPSETAPCCSDGVDTPNGPGTPGDVLGPNPYETLPAWIPACDGGGLVPTAPDLTDSENWAH